MLPSFFVYSVGIEIGFIVATFVMWYIVCSAIKIANRKWYTTTVNYMSLSSFTFIVQMNPRSCPWGRPEGDRCKFVYLHMFKVFTFERRHWVFWHPINAHNVHFEITYGVDQCEAKETSFFTPVTTLQTSLLLWNNCLTDLSWWCQVLYKMCEIYILSYGWLITWKPQVTNHLCILTCSMCKLQKSTSLHGLKIPAQRSGLRKVQNPVLHEGFRSKCGSPSGQSILFKVHGVSYSISATC